MERIWLRHYPAGVPAEIDPSRYASLSALLQESFARFADRPAYAGFGETLTYGEIDRLSHIVAAWL